MNKIFYNPTIEDIFNLLNLGEYNVVGSSSLRGQYYESDYDLFCVVNTNNLQTLQTKIMKMAKQLNKYVNLYLVDIKLGLNDNKKLIPDNLEWDFKKKILKGYNYDELINRLETIKGHLSEKEYKTAKTLLVPKPNFDKSTKIMKELRFNILRWNLKELMDGYKIVEGEHKYIKDAVKDNTIFKIDVLYFLDSEFVEISIIYDIRFKGYRLTYENINLLKSLKDDINYYITAKKYYKALKRELSYYRYLYKTKGDEGNITTKINNISNILYSNLIMIYKSINLIEALIKFEELGNNNQKNKIKAAINKIIQYLSNCDIEEYVKKEKQIMKKLHNTLKRVYNINTLQSINDTLNDIINKATYNMLKRL